EHLSAIHECLLSLSIVRLSAAHAQAAVDGNDGAGDEAGGVRAQEGNGRRYLLGRAEAAEWDLAGQFLATRLRQRVSHGRADGARLDDVGRDVPTGQLARH